MKKSSPPAQHDARQHSFLLRTWYESEHDGWRFYLKETSSGEHWLFANYPKLVAFLAEHLGNDDAAS